MAENREKPIVSLLLDFAKFWVSGEGFKFHLTPENLMGRLPALGAGGGGRGFLPPVPGAWGVLVWHAPSQGRPGLPEDPTQLSGAV